MPVTYRLDPDEEIITTTCSGVATIEEVLEHFEALESDHALPERLDVLLDLVDMTSTPDTSQLKEVVHALDRPEVRWGACAIVASRDVVFGMLRMFEVFAEGKFESTRVFREREQAWSWLRSERSRMRLGR